MRGEVGLVHSFAIQFLKRIRTSSRLFAARFFDFSFLFYKLTMSLLKFPYYFFADRRFFTFEYAKTIVDRTLNLEVTYNRKIESIDLRTLKSLLNGPAPKLDVLFESQYGNINFSEAVSISYLIQALQPKVLFEIGTFDGFSTYHLAMNSPDTAKVFTLNLPPDSSFEDYHKLYSLTEYRGDLLTHELGKSLGIGRMYRESPVAHKVTQLFGDSLEFNFSPYRKSVDLCFIDGGHSYLHMASDTKNAMSILTDMGVAIWHDYNIQHREIYRFLNELSETYRLFHLEGTRLVIFFGKAVPLSWPAPVSGS